MCGEVPLGHHKQDVVLHFQANQSQIRLNLPQQLEHVVEIWINEITVEAPNGGAVAPNLWRLLLSDNLQSTQLSNAPGNGYAFNITASALSHVSYDRPRVLSINNKGQLNHIGARLETVSGAGAVADATFASATISLSIIMKDPLWVPEQILYEDKLIPTRFLGPLSTKSRF